MKIIKNSDIKFRINKKLVYLPNFTIRFYTVNQKEYFLEKTQDDLVEYEREATVDDVDVILSGGTTVTEYYLPLNWNQLMFVGKGVLNYKLTNNIEDPEFPDYQYNKEEIVTTDFYIDSIEVDPEPEEGLIERIVLLEEHLAEEIVNREQADATITENLNAEEARAISAETALDEKIDAEETRASGEEQRIEGKLDQEIADRQTDVNAEEARAISAETALDAKIDAETNRATSAETTLNEALTDEVNRATSAETTLDEKIVAETNRAISAETVLQEAIDAEETRATTAENAISGALDSYITTNNAALQNEITRATAAESALDTKANTISGNVITETTRATAKEDAISGKLDTYIASNDAALQSEVTRATTAEEALQTAINDEATARANADTALQTAITNEVSRAKEAESGITNSLNAEVTRATGAENALDAKIDAETTRATSAEAALDVKIGTVSGNVISETSRATTAEEALSGAIDSLDVRFFDDAKYEDSGNTKVINFYNAGVVKATIDASDFIVDGMVEDVRIENGYLVIDFNTASGKQDIQIPLTDIFNPNNYYTKSETSGATEIATALAQKLAISNFNAYSGAVDTLINSKASQSDLDALNGVVTAHTSDSTIHLTSGNVQTQIDNSISGKANSSDVYLKSETSGATEIANALAQKQNQLVAGENITIDANNVISAEGGGKAVNGGTNISITTGATADTINCTLPLSSSTSSNASKIILDKNYSFISNDAVISGKNDIAYASKSIVLGANSLLGDGSGANIEYNLAFGSGNKVTASGVYKPTASHNFILGTNNDIYNATNCFAFGYANHLKKSHQFVVGDNNTVLNESETLFGRYNVSSSASTTWGNSGNTLFSVGNGTSSARHNAFEIRQNGDIYITLDGQDVKLQDQLGGTSYTAGDGIDITNDVISVTGKVSTSDFNTYSGAVETALSGKADSTDVYTKTEVDNAITAATSTKQDTLISSVNIKTINNESLLGSGNIDIQGGGGTVESAITSGSTNAVESKAIWSAVTYDVSINETLEFDNTTYAATNYPSGCNSVRFESNTGSILPTGDYIFTSGGSEVAKLTYSIISWYPYEASWTSSDPKLTYVAEGDSAVTASYSELASDIDGVTVPSTFITSYTATASGENRLWINENTYRKDEVYNKSEINVLSGVVDTKLNTISGAVDTKLDAISGAVDTKLDATAYTPTVVDSALSVTSSNPVQNKALYNELRIGANETVITFDSDKFSENYPVECRKIKVEVTGTTWWSSIVLLSDKSESGSTDNKIEWYNNGSQNPLSVTLGSGLTEAGATYTISGDTFEVSYPSINNIQYIYALMLHSYETIKAITGTSSSVTTLKDQVVENTTALGGKVDTSAITTSVTSSSTDAQVPSAKAVNDKLGGLSLVKLTQAEYDALATKDNNTLYVIVG